MYKPHFVHHYGAFRLLSTFLASVDIANRNMVYKYLFETLLSLFGVYTKKWDCLIIQ